MKTVKEIKKEINRHFIHGGPSEFDQGLNNLNRALIEAFARERGEAWLGKINRYKADRGKPYLVRYEGQQVYNFEYGFVVPCCDEELISLIKGREEVPYRGSREDSKLVLAIHKQIKEQGGIILVWV